VSPRQREGGGLGTPRRCVSLCPIHPTVSHRIHSPGPQALNSKPNKSYFTWAKQKHSGAAWRIRIPSFFFFFSWNCQTLHSSLSWISYLCAFILTDFILIERVCLSSSKDAWLFEPWQFGRLATLHREAHSSDSACEGKLRCRASLTSSRGQGIQHSDFFLA
jgi:hypothetical protein